MIYKHKAFTLVELLIVIAIIGFVLAIALPNYFKIGKTSKKTVCINNLKNIDAAIDQWVLDYNIISGTIPSIQQEEAIYNYVKGGKPICPSGGVYTIYATGSIPQVRCSVEAEGHKLNVEAEE